MAVDDSEDERVTVMLVVFVEVPVWLSVVVPDVEAELTTELEAVVDRVTEAVLLAVALSDDVWLLDLLALAEEVTVTVSVEVGEVDTDVNCVVVALLDGVCDADTLAVELREAERDDVRVVEALTEGEVVSVVESELDALVVIEPLRVVVGLVETDSVNDTSTTVHTPLCRRHNSALLPVSRVILGVAAAEQDPSGTSFRSLVGRACHQLASSAVLSLSTRCFQDLRQFPFPHAWGHRLPLLQRRECTLDTPHRPCTPRCFRYRRCLG